MIDIDFMIDTLESEVQILEGKLGIEQAKLNEWSLFKMINKYIIIILLIKDEYHKHFSQFIGLSKILLILP